MLSIKLEIYQPYYASILHFRKQKMYPVILYSHKINITAHNYISVIFMSEASITEWNVNVTDLPTFFIYVAVVQGYLKRFGTGEKYLSQNLLILIFHYHRVWKGLFGTTRMQNMQRQRIRRDVFWQWNGDLYWYCAGVTAMKLLCNAGNRAETGGESDLRARA